MSFQRYLDRLGSSSYLYGNASNGFKDFLAWLAESTGVAAPEVLMPSYIPAKLQRAALAAGCAVRFYEVSGPCRVDLAEVERKVGPRTIAIFHVHYFGFPGDVEGMRELARRRGAVLIEDCALTVDARHRGRELGTYGDVAIFSMRKMFLYPEGGALVLGDRYREFRPRYERTVSSCYSFPRFLAQRGKYAYVRLTGGADPLRIVRPGLMGYMDGKPAQTLSVKRLSAFTRARLGHVDLGEVVGRRRENFQYVLDRFPRSPAIEAMVRTLPEGCTPYSFPVLVRQGDRDALRTALLEDGVLAGAGWPESPFDPTLAGTRALAASLVEIPIHQALTRRQLDRSLRSLERNAAALARGGEAAPSPVSATPR